MGKIITDYPDAQFERHPHGAVMIDGAEVAHTLQCPHCNGHFVSRRGSGARRTYCKLCGAVTCGDRRCDPCTPFEKKLEQMERQNK